MMERGEKGGGGKRVIEPTKNIPGRQAWKRSSGEYQARKNGREQIKAVKKSENVSDESTHS
jgi:hypothetical protein